MIDYAARRFREEVAPWPDGVYESDAYVDHDPQGNNDIHVHCKITVEGATLTVDFTGSDDRHEIQAYSTFGNTRGYVVGQLAAMMDPDIPKNEGFFDSIELIVPQGCCSTRPPAGRCARARTTPAPRSARRSRCAMQDVVPDEAVPQIYKMGMPTVIFGTDPRTGATFIDHSVDIFAAYCGAVKGRTAGARRTCRFGNLNATAEINESLFPHIQWGRDYDTDSGGAGEWRGLCGSLYEKQVLVDAKVYTYVVGKKYPMPGIAGGTAGAPNELIVRYGSDDPYRVGTPPTGCRSARASASSTTTAAAAAGATRSTATPRPCSTTCSTST